MGVGTCLHILMLEHAGSRQAKHYTHNYAASMQETSSLSAQVALKACQPEKAHRQVDSDVQQEEMRQQAACAAWILQHGKHSPPRLFKPYLDAETCQCKYKR